MKFCEEFQDEGETKITLGVITLEFQLQLAATSDEVILKAKVSSVLPSWKFKDDFLSICNVSFASGEDFSSLLHRSTSESITLFHYLFL